MTFTAILSHYRVIPVVVVDDVEQTQTLINGLVCGGLPVAEVTLRTSAALGAIEELAGSQGILVGAGTVRTPQQAQEAVAAGAKFLVSPGLSAAVVRKAQELGVPILPGAVTATEIMAAQDLGLDTLKFFPAETSGGAHAVKALGAPFSDVHFVPTGGISQHNADQYLQLPNVVAIGGSWMVPQRALQEGDWQTIAKLSKQAVALASKAPTL